MLPFANILTYWAANATLNAALAASKVYAGLQADGAQFPYAVIVDLGASDQFTTGTPVVENNRFQISYYDTSLTGVISVSQTIRSQLHRATIDASTMAVHCTSDWLVIDPDTEKKVYHCLLEFEWQRNGTLP
jgi:hypothetical protein